MSDDPAGYRLDLIDALAESPPDPAAVARAYARCLQFRVSVGDDLTIRSLPLFSAAIDLLAAEIRRWAESARTLGQRWVATDDPWEADELVWPMIELRTEAESLLALLGDDLREPVSEFDAALRPEEGLLATITGTARMAAYRDSLDPVQLDGWWLNARPDEPDIPPADYWRRVREIIEARRAN